MTVATEVFSSPALRARVPLFWSEVRIKQGGPLIFSESRAFGMQAHAATGAGLLPFSSDRAILRLVTALVRSNLKSSALEPTAAPSTKHRRHSV